MPVGEMIFAPQARSPDFESNLLPLPKDYLGQEGDALLPGNFSFEEIYLSWIKEHSIKHVLMWGSPTSR